MQKINRAHFLKNAALIYFVVDVTAGLVPIDIYLSTIIRKANTNKKV